jgi:hypothetical protein
MGKLFDQLRNAGNIPGAVDYRAGSALEKITSVAPTFPGGTAISIGDFGHFGVKSQDTTAMLRYGNNAAWDLATTGTVLVTYTPHCPATTDVLVSKGNVGGGVNFYYLAINGNTVIGQIADGVGTQTLLNSTAFNSGVPNLFAIGWNGANVFGWINGVQIFTAVQTRVPNASASNLDIAGWSAAYPTRHGAVHGVTLVNRLLTGMEVTQYWEEWLAEGRVKNLPRRGFS